MHLLTSLLYIVFVWRWGDWRNWRKYYPTLLYVSMCNLLYNFICSNYLLWKWVPQIMLNHFMTDIVYIFITVPATGLLYLSRFPEGRSFQYRLAYFSAWVAAYTLIEAVWILFDKITYYHGWNLGWSFFFYIIMFTLIRIHFKKPLAALFLTALVIIFFIWVFDIPFNNKP